MTLRSAANLALTLHGMAQHEAARQLAEDTLTRMRRVLGEDHPDTVGLARHLAATTAKLREHNQARRLEERPSQERR